uniref:HAD family phosphatase n=1 Tax=Panagrellus redivivus TaxID=6233 RepID=A0A7E4VC81_PANRE
MGGVIIKYKNTQSMVDLFKKAKTNPEAMKAITEWDTGKIAIQDLQPVLAKLHEASKEELDGIIKGIATNTKNLDHTVIAAVKKLRANGFKTALLTNNGWIDHEHKKSVLVDDVSYFDVVVESCKVKLRKPDAAIYLKTTEDLGIAPEACIFVDDLAMNCTGAEAVGMTSIELAGGDSGAMLKKLTELTGVSFDN